MHESARMHSKIAPDRMEIPVLYLTV